MARLLFHRLQVDSLVYIYIFVCVCARARVCVRVCVCERERERECVYVRVHVCVLEFRANRHEGDFVLFLHLYACVREISMCV